jgi:hypothetical protein
VYKRQGAALQRQSVRELTSRVALRDLGNAQLQYEKSHGNRKDAVEEKLETAPADR